jgi:hypothetical protein
MFNPLLLIQLGADDEPAPVPLTVTTVPVVVAYDAPNQTQQCQMVPAGGVPPYGPYSWSITAGGLFFSITAGGATDTVSVQGPSGSSERNGILRGEVEDDDGNTAIINVALFYPSGL